MTFFVLVSEQGTAWVEGRSMREQEGWREHATFVNSLVAEGFIIVAGPLGDGPPHRALVIVSSPGLSEARRRLEEDPWMRSGILRVGRLEPWKILASDDRLDRVLDEITRSTP
ncbi:MAG: hypothetical protein WAK40_03380 [Thermoplasmata archaeon]